MWRNKYIFDYSIHQPTDLTCVIFELVWVISMDKWPHQTQGLWCFDIVYIDWKKPQRNFDTLNLLGFEGLIQYYNGKRLTGYTWNIKTRDIFYVKMWCMYEGLEIARTKYIFRLIMESDSKLIMNMVVGNFKIKGVTPVLIRRIHNLLNLPWLVQINHTLCEGNQSYQ